MRVAWDFLHLGLGKILSGGILVDKVIRGKIKRKEVRVQVVNMKGGVNRG